MFRVERNLGVRPDRHERSGQWFGGQFHGHRRNQRGHDRHRAACDAPARRRSNYLTPCCAAGQCGWARMAARSSISALVQPAESCAEWACRHRIGRPQPGGTSRQKVVMSAAQACRSALRAATTSGLGGGCGVVTAGRGHSDCVTCAAAGTPRAQRKKANVSRYSISCSRKLSRTAPDACRADTRTSRLPHPRLDPRLNGGKRGHT